MSALRPRIKVRLAATLAAAALLASVSSGGTDTEARTSAPSTTSTTCSSASKVKKTLAPERWQEKHPLADLDRPPCPGVNVEKLKRGFFRWRTYRLITPYAGCSGGGKWLEYTAIPGDVVSRESSCSWGAYNPSGACGPYQLLGWTSCSTGSWKDKMRHHRAAAHVLAVQGSNAWVAW